MKFSVVVPMYKVEQYLPDLLTSLDAQESGNYQLDCIFIDDGSPDLCFDLVEEWAKSTRHAVKLIRQDNQGVSAARNLGIRESTGDWITFPDPDDYLSNDYFRRVEEFLSAKKYQNVSLVATNILRYFEIDASIRDTHALRFKFARGTKKVDMNASPHYLHMSAPTAFFQLSVIQENDLGFDLGLHASEDALFTSRYLLLFENPFLGLVSEAKYYYRKRADESSALDSFKASAESYLTRFSDGYLPLFQKVFEELGLIPDWLATQICYEFRWLFGAETRIGSKEAVLSPGQRREFISNAGLLMSFLKPYQIEMYRTTSMHQEIRLLLLALAGVTFPRGTAQLWNLDAARNLLGLKYYFTGELPSEEIRVRAKLISPVYSKTRRLDYFGQEILRERIIWIPANSWVSLRLNGEPVTLSRVADAARKLAFTEQEIYRSFNTSRTVVLAAQKNRAIKMDEPPKITGVRSFIKWMRYREVSKKKLAPYKTPLDLALPSRPKGQKPPADEAGYRKLWRRASRDSAVKKFAHCWLLMDRINVAQDNAEHLYRYLKSERGDLNIWFVLERSSSDWSRLELEGFKLIEFGSVEHSVALLHAKHVVSSHADVEMTNPRPGRFYPRGYAQFRFTFLQHGITKDDLSLWLNTKKFDCVVTATEPEYESFVGDGTNYIFTKREVALTGFPRYDRLLRLAHEPGSEKEILLLAPTWRSTLFQPKTIGDPVRRLIDGFRETDFFKNWQELFSSDILRATADANKRVVLLPHPNLATVLGEFDLPDFVEIAGYDRSDVQALFAATDLLITDYSSVAFDVSYAGGKVLYFQFDSAQIFNGAHTMRQGYFSYERDGLGPVYERITDFEHVLSGDSSIDWNLYDERSKATFAFHDTHNCQRVVAAIEALEVPVKNV